MTRADVDLKRGNLARPALFFFVSLGLTLAVLASVPGTKPITVPPLIENPGIKPIAADDFLGAAESFRQGDFEAVLADLELRINEGSSDARVLLGLYAHGAERNALALEHLQAADAYRGELADWRLWALAESAETLGQTTLSRAVLERLVDEHPGSPLSAPAIERLASRAADRDDWISVLAIVEEEYDPDLDESVRDRLARLHWQAGQKLGDRVVERDAAVRLLVYHPLSASELEVAEPFRHENGDLTWSSFLSTEELIIRGESLLAVNLPESALDTLAQVPEASHDLEWHLAQARALTAARRGEDALAALGSLVGDTLERTARLEWERARAAIEVSTPRRGRRHLTVDQRTEMRSRAHEHLHFLVEINDERFVSRALRLLFADLLEDNRFEEALAMLERLKELDPHDTTGARPLWGFGWKEFAKRNYSGAVGYWAELAELYPHSNYTRSGLYWSARGHEKLGNSARAQELYQAVVDVDFTDIYRRHALERLDREPVTTAEEGPSLPWPTDEILDRAQLLHTLGLDEAALLEVEAYEVAADKRALEALRARVLAAKGERRQSILALRRAFPILGTPHQSLAPSEARRLYYPRDFQEIVEEHARSQRLPSHLVFGLIRQESAFDTTARSWAGAQGLMQIMPATGKELALRLGLPYSRERLSDPGFSVQLGTSYLRQVLEMFDGDEVLALAGYNAGPYRIKKLWRQAGSEREIDAFLEELSYEETKSYVKRVLLYSDSYRRLYEPAS